MKLKELETHLIEIGFNPVKNDYTSEGRYQIPSRFWIYCGVRFQIDILRYPSTIERRNHKINSIL